MRLGIITYDQPHLKTEQLVMGLALNGAYSFHLFALPFFPRPARPVRFSHRPAQGAGAPTSALAKRYDARFERIADPDEIRSDGIDYFLVAGANLLPEGFVNRHPRRILNSHPGLTPAVRGLDAFKWAIHDGQPLGVTLHFIDEGADTGEVIAQSPTPIFTTDSIEALARRHYELELQMLIAFERLLAQPRPARLPPERPARLRMSAQKEAAMLETFPGYRDRFSSDAPAAMERR